jgi:hypothetical protein
MTIKEQPGLDPRELAARGLTADLRLAVEHDVSQAVRACPVVPSLS